MTPLNHIVTAYIKSHLMSTIHSIKEGVFPAMGAIIQVLYML